MASAREHATALIIAANVVNTANWVWEVIRVFRAHDPLAWSVLWVTAAMVAIVWGISFWAVRKLWRD